MFAKLSYLLLILIFLQSLSHATHAVSLLEPQADSKNLSNYMAQIIHPTAFRNHKNIEELDRVAAYIKQQVEQFGVPCEYQTYQVKKQTYRNVVCGLQTGNAKKVIVGAHYDVYGNFKGADDNASGVAGLIEIARILAANKINLKQNIELVFYTLEEPPYFRTEHMGSAVHAKSILNKKDQITAVYILEMIGYFDAHAVQDYPTGLALFYPEHGNFIAAVSNFNSRTLSENYCKAMQTLKKLDCQRLIAPAFISGTDFSDHLNYWKMEIPAIMITDTAFFRNKHYHTAQDTVDKLNVDKMADVVNGLAYTLLETMQ
ncbi:M20/M25/M40 family metallo-hydrolase [Acinetobacter sp. Marseille-Q1618]|uniref:M20/M25/M40 family metallo-hydrolase n=1 Tax=Acinetobacter sp. Marseille-Q1618 TaxID=2697502 RepID=UPI00157085E1|nr:M20/M25/M40 family metallo-hydrolase [Acinetobacter sp. Marseille-Q1618]